MKTKIVLPLVFATVLLGGYPAPQVVRANPSVFVAQSIWKPFSSPEGGFRVLMPGTPIPGKDNVNTQSGSIPINFFVAVRPEEAFYVVAYADFPRTVSLNSREVQELLPKIDPTAAQREGVRVVNQRNIRLGNYPGRELKLQDREGFTLRWRAYLVNKRLYQIGVVTNKEASLTKSIDGFFNSFQLVNNGRNPAIAQQPSLQELGNSLKQAVCSQNWSQALKIADQMIAIAPNAQTRRQLTDYRSQIQALARTGTKVPSSSLPDCGGRR